MTAHIILIAAAVIVSQGILWASVFLWLRRRLSLLTGQMTGECSSAGRTILLGPDPCNYRGARSVFGTVRGNGVICLTDRSIMFRKLFGDRIEIPIQEIGKVTVEDWFMGKAAAGTGGKILVIHTADRNEIGFLLKEAAAWEDRLNSLLLS